MSVLRNFNARAAPWRRFSVRPQSSSFIYSPNLTRKINTGGIFPTKRSTFTVLAVFGATTYVIYTAYEYFTVFPSELRGDLRSGIKAQLQGDFVSSELYLRRAWYNCDGIARKRFGPDPWLKLSGIACKLGEVLEGANKLDQAYDVYWDCFGLMLRRNQRLSMVERQRAVAIAMHLAELANKLGMQDAEESWLIWSVNQCFEIFPSDRPLLNATGFSLPDWLRTNPETLDAALEALASFYAKTGNAYLTYKVYNTAAEIMKNPPAARLIKMTPRRYCRIAMLVNNASSSLIDYRPSPENIEAVNDALQTSIRDVEEVRRGLRVPEPECEHVWSTLLFNFAAVLEMQNKREEAREHFKRVRTHAQSIGMSEGLREADAALARLSAQDSAKDQTQR